ncbi:DUF1289 domain-containing protein [Ramlibacter rhizophilus]|uniref:DUF1289 domain-containing protein n=1 Tax=Ramlibacter rhizophilus TaxID=1781167 RepID=A0A4Z0BMM1_9BURK|nr:DUF1289 domain-containing protein [Ramlibacter rhizophilus]TFY99507.1 DUF1289 domain-containing protein [Ramlibacter rhizophilus]
MNPRARELLLRARIVRSAPQDEAVPSPCLSVCRMDPQQRLCEGCLRTLDEIAAWGGLPEPAKRAVWARIEARARGGDAA